MTGTLTNGNGHKPGPGVFEGEQMARLSAAAALRSENLELQNSLRLIERLENAKSKTLNNSLYSLMQGAQNQSALGSFTALAYHNIYAPLTMNWTQLTYMYKTHGVIQAAIDMPVLDALRGGIEITSDELDADDIKDLNDLLEQTGTLRTIAETAIWARLYGGAAIIINADQEPDEPLDDQHFSELELYAADRWELSATHRDADVYNWFGTQIDGSRVLTLSGKPAPRVVRTMLQGWGMSEIEKMIEPFNAYLRINDVIYELLREAKLDVFKFKGFTGQLASAAGTQGLLERTSIMQTIKNYQSAVVMDKEDEFEQKQISFSGLAEMKKQNQVDLASALRIPMTKLFGLSASGFNSGEDDIENYNAMVESEVREPLKPIIRAVVNLRCTQLFGEKFDLAFTFKPLRVMSTVDEETVKTNKHNRYVGLYDKGLLTGEECMGLMQTENLISIVTQVSEGAEPEAPGGLGGLEQPLDEEGKGFPDEPDKTPDEPEPEHAGFRRNALWKRFRVALGRKAA